MRDRHRTAQAECQPPHHDQTSSDTPLSHPCATPPYHRFLGRIDTRLGPDDVESGDNSYTSNNAKQTTLKKDLQVVSEPVPFGMIPHDFDADLHYQEISQEFPWMYHATNEIMGHIVNSHANNAPFRFPPLLLSGMPGIGKTRWVRRIASVIGPNATMRVPLAGVSTVLNILGSDQVYEGSRPGGWFDAIRLSGIANPIMVLDEIDKTQGSEARINPADAYINFLERENSAQFHCPYFRLPIDLSTINYIAIANTPETISPALADRLNEIKCPAPRWDDVEARLPSFLKEAADGFPVPAGFSINEDAIRETYRKTVSLRAVIQELRRQIAAHLWQPPPSQYATIEDDRPRIGFMR